MHTSCAAMTVGHLGAGIPRPSRRALASAPQDEEDVCMPSPIDLILRSGHRPRLEGRTAPMQGSETCIPWRFRAQMPHRLDDWIARASCLVTRVRIEIADQGADTRNAV